MSSVDSAPPSAPFEPLEVTDGSVIDSQFYVFYSLFGLIHIALLIMYVLQILAAKRIEKERARYEKNLLLQSTFKKKTFSPKTRPRSNSDHVRRGSDLPSLVSQTPHMDGTKTLGPSRKPIQRHSLPDIASGLRSAAEQEEVLLRMPTETKTSSTFTMSATRSNNRDDEKLCRYPTDNFSVTRTATSSQRFYNEFEVDRASTITSPSSIHTSHSNDKISVVTSGSDLDCPPTNATIARMPSAPTLAAAAATYALVHGESEEAIDEEDGWHRDQGGEATPKVFDREHVIDIPAGGAGAGAGTATHATEESPPSSVDNTPRRATNANTDEVSVTVTVTVTNTNTNTNTATQPTTETTVSLPMSADSVALRMQSDEISPPRMTSFANIGSLETAAAESAHHTSSVLPFTTAMPYGSRLQPMAEDAPENSAAEGSVSRRSRPVNNKGSRQQSLLRYGQDKKTAKAAASKEVSRSKSKSKRVVNFPRVGRVHVAFHWCGILVCAIQLVQLIDYFGINGIYPLWTVRMWSNMTTFAEIAASAYVVYDFIRLRYVSLFATVPKELSLFLGGIVALTAMFIIAGVVARSVSNQQWTFGLYFAWYGVAIISLAATLDYNVFHLTKRINELKAHWDTQAKKTFPQPPEKKVSHSRTPSRSRSRLAPKIATLTISPVPANQADSSADSSPATPDIKKLNVFSPSPKAFREQMAAAAWASNSEPPSPNAGPFSAPVSPLIGSSPVGGSSAGSPRNGRETPEYSFVSEVRESVSKKSPVASQLFSHNGNESRRNSVRGVITESQIRNLQPMANKASLKAQATLREVVKNMTKMAAFFTAFALFFGVFCLYTGCMRFADPYKLQSVNEPERFSSASSDVIGAVAQLSFLLASFWYAFIPLKYLHHNFFLPTSPSDQVAV